MNAEETGGCMCGRLRYRVTGKPNWVVYCHCADCRRSSAAPVSLFVGLNEAQFTITAGVPADFPSSQGVVRSFCRDCGTPLTYRSRRFPGEVHVLIGSLDEPERFTPTGHVWLSEKLSWFDTTDQLPRFARSGADEPTP
jgi:hypothetical protein